jgi:anti-anti-sigma factor
MRSHPGRGSASDWDGHLLLLHRSEPERQASVAAWVHRGLERGEKVYYTERPAPKDELPLLPTLARHGLDVSQIPEGQLSILPVPDFYPRAGQVDLVMRALDEGYTSVRLSAESHAALSYVSPRRHRDIEETMEDLCRELPVSAMCQYDALTTLGSRLVEAVTTHPVAVRASDMMMRRGRGVMTVSGELDLTNSDLLRFALGQATEGRTDLTSFSLILADLDFLDIAGCRALLLGTERFRRSGGQLYLESAPKHVTRVLRALGVTRQIRVSLGE